MSLRNRLTLVAAGAVAAVVVVVSVVGFVAVAASLRSQADTVLRRQAAVLATGPLPPARLPISGGPPPLVQLVSDAGAVTPVPADGPTLPLIERARRVAAGRHRSFLDDVHLGEEHLRVLVVPITGGRALEVAGSMEKVDDVLRRLAGVLLAVGIGGMAAAVVVGRAVAGAALSPLVRLSRDARAVAASRAPGRRLGVTGAGELDTLAGSFNAMLAALDDSLRAQRQLVADASHELRTPLTTLRTNVEVLARAPELAPHAPLLADVVAELEHMATLVSDLVDLARTDAAVPTEARSEVRLDQVAASVLERAGRRRPDVAIVADLQPLTVFGDRDRLERAVSNIVDNAVKWSPPGESVDVRVGNGELTVRDRGPGIDPADLPLVFDRFFRSGQARHLPGSGLGLAIVRQVAEAHGGTVTAEAAEGGGTRLRLRLPAATSG